MPPIVAGVYGQVFWGNAAGDQPSRPAAIRPLVGRQIVEEGLSGDHGWHADKGDAATIVIEERNATSAVALRQQHGHPPSHGPTSDHESGC